MGEEELTTMLEDIKKYKVDFSTEEVKEWLFAYATETVRYGGRSLDDLEDISISKIKELEMSAKQHYEHSHQIMQLRLEPYENIPYLVEEEHRQNSQ